MKLILQRVTESRCNVDGSVTGQTKQGFVVLVGVTHDDTDADARYLAQRTVSLRVFEDAAGKMNRSIADINGEILAVSQFTLYADTRKGNRPSFIRASRPEHATPIYEAYVAALRRELGEAHVATGIFGANMQIELINDGPVTIELCSDHRKTRPSPKSA